MNKCFQYVGSVALALVFVAASAHAQFTMPPPAEPVDPLPPSVHPLPKNAEPVPAAEECHLRGNDIYFGNYTSGQSRPLETVMGMTVGCTASVRLSVSVSPSPDSPSFEYRMMRHQGGDNASLRYQLYTDWSRSIPWGDGTGGSRPIVQTIEENGTVDVFCTVFANQDAPPGDYSDDILVTFDVQ